jgi:hypothetical protein
VTNRYPTARPEISSSLTRMRARMARRGLLHHVARRHLIVGCRHVLLGRDDHLVRGERRNASSDTADKPPGKWIDFGPVYVMLYVDVLGRPLGGREEQRLVCCQTLPVRRLKRLGPPGGRSSRSQSPSAGHHGMDVNVTAFPSTLKPQPHERPMSSRRSWWRIRSRCDSSYPPY